MARGKKELDVQLLAARTSDRKALEDRQGRFGHFVSPPPFFFFPFFLGMEYPLLLA